MSKPIHKINRSDKPLYSVGTWDGEIGEFTRQIGLAKSFRLTLRQLRRAIRELRAMGYPAYRVRDKFGNYDSDPMVLIERTDEMSAKAVKESWKRK